MSAPTELSFDEILKFMLAHNGKVTNYELVKHFKVFLMNPDMRDQARNTFKKHVNTLGIIKNQNNEKWIILKKKYFPNNDKENEDVISKLPESPSAASPTSPPEQMQPPYRPPPPVQLNQDFSILTNILQDSRSAVNEAPPETPLYESKESLTSILEEVPPKVHPRRKSSDKVNEKRSSLGGHSSHRSSIPNQDMILDEPMSPPLTTSRSESMLVDNEQTISVKERKQMFNRMASEGDVLKSNKLGGNFNQSVDEDRASLDPKSESDPLDSKQKQWILCAARGEYHALAKMCKENAKLVKTKDPFTVSYRNMIGRLDT
ncbi:ankyrin repeat domain-containing protein SOWAHB [Pectinophora gossypiella]|uniref:ankyrin repeat domain-containing protein SOWAHB n=1 Tax=Pectinophora gossypiella TaxID=13191 RepID=UPI00214F57AC|nr:ankyrin repeat domain-containing protein SOWAHB [Pectinophora gossypiella]